MPFLTSVSLKSLFQNYSDKIDFTVVAPTGFADFPKETQESVISMKLFNHPFAKINNFAVLGVDIHNETIVTVSISFESEFIAKLEALEAEHKEFLDGANEVFDTPIEVKELQVLAASGMDTFLVRVSPFFIHESDYLKKKILSKKIIGNGLLQEASFVIEEELYKSPVFNCFYAKCRILDLNDQVPNLKYQEGRVERIWSEIKRDYPAHSVLKEPYDERKLTELVNNPNLHSDGNIVFKHFVEISKEELDIRPTYSLKEVIQSNVYRGTTAHTVEVDYAPVAVNPITHSTIFVVDGSISV